MEDLHEKNATLRLNLVADSGYKNSWSIRCSPLQYKAIVAVLNEKRRPEWVTLDWNDKKTWPEEQRKVWVVSDKVRYEEELICYRDGDFYRNTEDWPIDKELEAGLKWCYVVKPERPE